MKCDQCGNKIEETFLGKIRGTYIGKKTICPLCQKKNSQTKEDTKQ
ncbi:MAG: hypothetical protein Q7R96_04955 [Nanoarchaeota archaeon]|nr:hypothetical protein [Nanoarchaeota archaeon]